MAAEHRIPRLILLAVERLLAVEPADRGGIEDRLGAGHRGEPGGLGIPLVPADERPHGESARGHAHEARITWGKIKLLVVVRVVRDVHLAIHAGRGAIGLEDHGGVVEEAGAPPLENAPHEHDVVRLRRGGEPVGERPGHHLGLGKLPVVLGLAGVFAGEELLEADDLGPLLRRRGDPGDGLNDVGLAIGGAGRLHEADADGGGRRRRGPGGALHTRHGTSGIPRREDVVPDRRKAKNSPVDGPSTTVFRLNDCP